MSPCFGTWYSKVAFLPAPEREAEKTSAHPAKEGSDSSSHLLARILRLESLQFSGSKTAGRCEVLEPDGSTWCENKRPTSGGGGRSGPRFPPSRNTDVFANLQDCSNKRKRGEVLVYSINPGGNFGLGAGNLEFLGHSLEADATQGFDLHVWFEACDL